MYSEPRRIRLATDTSGFFVAIGHMHEKAHRLLH